MSGMNEVPSSPIQLSETNHDFEQNQTNGSTYKRQPSIKSHGASFGALFSKDSITPLSPDVLNPPVPESLPTTPGYEIDHNEMFTGRASNPHIPDQQLPTRPIHNRKNSKPNDIYSQNKRSNTLENFNLALSRFKLRGPAATSDQNQSKPIAAQTFESVALQDFNEHNGGQNTNFGDDGVPDMTLHNPPKNKSRVIASCAWIFLAGLSDSAPGAILPNIENYYNISYSIVSLIWMANAVGYFIIAVTSSKLQPYLGRRNSLIVGAISSCINYVLVGTGTKFPVIVFGFVFGGIGIAINISQVNIFLSRLKNSERYLGCFHGSYGFGATVSPLIATGMINNGIKWHYYYFLLFGLMFINIFSLAYTFQNSDIDLKPWDHKEEIHASPPPTPQTETETFLHGSHEEIEPIAPKRVSEIHLAIRNKVTWLLSLFVFFYQGGEVSLGGWIVTFLLDYRHGKPSSTGYVPSGFWFGLTLGRFILTPLIASYVGLRRGVFSLVCFSIFFVALIWGIKQMIADSVFVSIAGIFIGPIYPLLITLAAKILPKKIQVLSLTVMTAFGSSGGAVHPFIIGLISQTSGTFVVLPYFIGLFSAMSIGWMCLPNVERKIVHSTWWRNVW